HNLARLRRPKSATLPQWKTAAQTTSDFSQTRLLRWRRDARGLPTAPKRIRDKTRCLHVLDEGFQGANAGQTPFRRTHGLTDIHEAVLHDAHAGVLVGVGRERLPHAGNCIELVLDEDIEGVGALAFAAV